MIPNEKKSVAEVESAISNNRPLGFFSGCLKHQSQESKIQNTYRGIALATVVWDNRNVHSQHVENPKRRSCPEIVCWKIKGMEPENHLFEEENHPNHTFIFGFKMLIFRGLGEKKKCTPDVDQLEPENDGFQRNLPLCLGAIFRLHVKLWEGLKKNCMEDQSTTSSSHLVVLVAFITCTLKQRPQIKSNFFSKLPLAACCRGI